MRTLQRLPCNSAQLFRSSIPDKLTCDFVELLLTVQDLNKDAAGLMKAVGGTVGDGASQSFVRGCTAVGLVGAAASGLKKAADNTLEEGRKRSGGSSSSVARLASILIGKCVGTKLFRQVHDSPAAVGDDARLFLQTETRA